MTERRSTPKLLGGRELDAALPTVGMRLGGGAFGPAPSFEHVLVSAVAEAISADYRLLSVATTWIGAHAPRLHIGELARLLPVGERRSTDPARYRAYWAGVAHWQRKDNRWAKIAKMYDGPPVYLSHLGDDIAALTIERKGEDPRFAGSRLRAPVGLLRDRASDVDSPAMLARRHPWYRERIRQGPTYRADCWAELQRDPRLTPAALARRVGCTYPIAHRAVQDWNLIQTARPTGREAGVLEWLADAE